MYPWHVISCRIIIKNKKKSAAPPSILRYVVVRMRPHSLVNMVTSHICHSYRYTTKYAHTENKRIVSLPLHATGACPYSINQWRNPFFNAGCKFIGLRVRLTSYKPSSAGRYPKFPTDFEQKSLHWSVLKLTTYGIDILNKSAWWRHFALLAKLDVLSVNVECLASPG